MGTTKLARPKNVRRCQRQVQGKFFFESVMWSEPENHMPTKKRVETPLLTQPKVHEIQV